MGVVKDEIFEGHRGRGPSSSPAVAPRTLGEPAWLCQTQAWRISPVPRRRKPPCDASLLSATEPSGSGRALPVRGFLNFPSVSLWAPGPPLTLVFQSLFLSWAQYNWLAFIFLNYNCSLVLLLWNYTLIPLIEISIFPISSVTHLQSFGLFPQMAGLMHYVWVLQVVSQRANLFLNVCWVPWPLLCFIHMCDESLFHFEWDCLVSLWGNPPIGRAGMPVRETEITSPFFPTKFLIEEGIVSVEIGLELLQKHTNSCLQLGKLKPCFTVLQ